MQRVDAILTDKEEVDMRDAEAATKMERLARDYEPLLASIFNATSLVHGVKVDFAKIVL